MIQYIIVTVKIFHTESIHPSFNHLSLSGLWDTVLTINVVEGYPSSTQ